MYACSHGHMYTCANHHIMGSLKYSRGRGKAVWQVEASDERAYNTSHG